MEKGSCLLRFVEVIDLYLNEFVVAINSSFLQTSNLPYASQEYYKAICSGDFGKAASLCDTICMTGHIEEVRNVWEQQDSTITAIIADILSETEVEITDIQKDGDNRNVFYKLANPSYEGKEEIAVVGNEEGEWKIKTITDRH